MRHTRIVVATAAMVFCGSVHVQATDQKRLALCKSDNLELALLGCSDIVNRYDGTATEIAAAYVLRAKAYRSKGQHRRAFEDMDDALRKVQDYPPAVAAQCDLLVFEAVQWEDATERCNEAVRLSPRDPSILSLRGQMFRATDQLNDALRDFNAALALDPDNVNALGGRGAVYNSRKETDRAIQDLSRAIRIDNRNTFALSELADAYFNMKQFARAVAYYDQVLALDPNSKWDLAHRGAARNVLGQTEGAFSDLTQALTIDPKYQWALGERAEAYEKTGKLELAVADMNAALLLKPDDEWAIERLRSYQVKLENARASNVSVIDRRALSRAGLPLPTARNPKAKLPASYADVVQRGWPLSAAEVAVIARLSMTTAWSQRTEQLCEGTRCADLPLVDVRTITNSRITSENYFSLPWQLGLAYPEFHDCLRSRDIPELVFTSYKLLLWLDMQQVKPLAINMKEFDRRMGEGITKATKLNTDCAGYKREADEIDGSLSSKRRIFIEMARIGAVLGSFDFLTDPKIADEADRMLSWTDRRIDWIQRYRSSFLEPRRESPQPQAVLIRQAVDRTPRMKGAVAANCIDWARSSDERISDKVLRRIEFDGSSEETVVNMTFQTKDKSNSWERIGIRTADDGAYMRDTDYQMVCFAKNSAPLVADIFEKEFTSQVRLVRRLSRLEDWNDQVREADTRPSSPVEAGRDTARTAPSAPAWGLASEAQGSWSSSMQLPAGH